MKPQAWALALSLGIAALAGACGPREEAPVSAFEGRLDDWTREILSDSPELAAESGAPPALAGDDYTAQLDDRSARGVEVRRTAAIRRLAELRALDISGLTAEDQLTYDILNTQFEAAAAGATHEFGRFSSFGAIRPYVLNPLDSAFLTLPDFLERKHAIASIDDAQSYLARLRAVPAAIDGETERARLDAEAGVIPPIYIVDATISLLDSSAGQAPALSPYVVTLRQKLDALAAAEANEAARTEIQTRAFTLIAQAEAIVRDRIAPAERRAAAQLRAVRPRATEDAGVWRLPDGEAFYRDALRIETTTDLTPDQIHRIGLDRVRDLTAELDLALRRVGLTEGPVGTRMAALTADPRYRYPDTDEGRAELFSDVEARIARVMSLAPRWFGVLPKARLEVRRVPAYQEATAPGAFYFPPSVDGQSPGIYFINVRDLSEMTRIDVPTQDFHEAAPGHHFQIALAQQQTDIPLLRRLISFNAYTEGWGLYAEQFADEQGLHDGDPIGRIGYLRWQLWRAARLVVDTGLHAKHWTRQQAIDYLSQTTGDAPGVIVTEVDRYITWPGQACGYELGRREIMRLREEARTALGPDFDLKGFHDAVLLHGEVPLPVLDEIVRAWIPQQRENAENARRRGEG